MDTSGRISSLFRIRGPLRRALLTAGAFSAVINLLMLVSPLYMLQIYDRVLTSQSEATLLALTLLAVGLLAVMAILEIVRSRILVRVSGQIEEALSARALAALFHHTLQARGGHNVQALRDLDGVRQFVSGPSIFAFFDAPWTPIFLVIIFIFHPVLGLIAAGGAAALFILAVVNDLSTRKPLGQAAGQSLAAYNFIDLSFRNAEAIQAMGIFPEVQKRWGARRNQILDAQAQASDRAGVVTGLSRFLRLVLQVAILGTGAYLTLHEEISAGMIVAASVLLGRALAPVEMTIGSWRQFLSARTAWRRLHALLETAPPEETRVRLPDPTGELSIEQVVAIPPGGRTATLKRVDFKLAAGEALAVLGASGAGKSTLARLLVGAWPPYAGTIRLDGADIHRWDRSALGPHIGYLPQDVELFDGSIAENIARFGALDSPKIVAAAKEADVHDLILRLPQGYETPIGPGGSVLSAGQRQRIGLARALYGDPVLLVLDEPNSNLDEEGETALIRAIARAKERGCTTVVISHRASILNVADRVLILADGLVRACGPQREVLAQLTRAVAAASAATSSAITPPPAYTVAIAGQASQ